MYTIWHGGDVAAAEFLLEYTDLGQLQTAPTVSEIQDSRNRSFVGNPDLIRDILYLDKPDVIVTRGFPERPVLAIEFSKEAMTGHDAFQRFARIVAGAEFGTPYAYFFPERKWVQRANGDGWDYYNPLVFEALRQVSRFHRTPILPFFWETEQACYSPLATDSRFPTMPDSDRDETQHLIDFVNLVLRYSESGRDLAELEFDRFVMQREQLGLSRASTRGGFDGRVRSPLTSTQSLDTPGLVALIKQRTGGDVELANLPEFVRDRDLWLVYENQSRSFRADPYGGATLAVDYLRCRTGPSVRERDQNLVVSFPRVPMKTAAKAWESYYLRRCPFRPTHSAESRYLTLHLRDGCRFTKNKEVRLFFSSADMIVFQDGFLF